MLPPLFGAPWEKEPPPHGVVTHTLAESERPRVVYEYEVRGDKTFPLGLLHRDRAWFADPEGAQNILAYQRRHEISYTVRLHSLRRPSLDLWESYGWTILD